MISGFGLRLNQGLLTNFFDFRQQMIAGNPEYWLLCVSPVFDKLLYPNIGMSILMRLLGNLFLG
jgi:hypothetical protein